MQANSHVLDLAPKTEENIFFFPLTENMLLLDDTRVAVDEEGDDIVSEFMVGCSKGMMSVVRDGALG